MATNTNLEKSIKEHVDALYEELKDGPKVLRTKEFPSLRRAVLTLLKRRGAIASRQSQADGRENEYIYVPTIPPTKLLYRNVTADYRESVRRKNDAYSGKRKAGTEPARGRASLTDLTDGDLWAELKRRGYRIEGGSLVKTVELK